MSDGFPPPPPSPSPTPAPPPPPPPPPYEQQPWAQPGWGGPKPSRGSSTGLIVALSVGGGLLVVALLGTLLYTVGKAVTASGGPRTSPTAGARPGDEPTATSTSDPTPTVAGTDAEEDVRIAGCAVDSVTSWPAARMEIVNGSGAAADYYVTVEFLDEDGTRVADGIVGVVGLAPGRTAKKKAQGLDTAPDHVTCRITEVHRTPSVG